LIKGLCGCNFGMVFHWVQSGDAKQREHLNGAERRFWRRRNLCKLGAPQLFLINHDMWDRFLNTKLIQTTPPPSLVPLLFLPLTMGPTTAHLLSCELSTNYPSADPIMNRSQSKNGTRVNRRWKLTNNISLESSQRREHARAVYFRFSAL
jgi:hypothetical protein